MDKPIRIQRKLTKGWKSPPNTVYVGLPSRWGNPFKIGVDGTAEECVNKYINMLLPYSHKTGNLYNFYLSNANLNDIKDSLKGKNLSCFCPLDQPCHADFLLRIANDYRT